MFLMRVLSALIFTFPVFAKPSLAERLRKKAESARLICEPGKPCSPSVGLVSVVHEKDARQCTGSLIGEDLVLTNGHCVPKAIKREGSSCRGIIFITFAPDANRKFETRIGCDQIVYSRNGEGDEQDRPDYAVFRLAHKSERPFLKISRNGMSEGESFEAIKVDPASSSGVMRGIQRRATCKSFLNTYYSQESTMPNAFITQIGECGFRHGNSGSPLIGREGSIRGVFFGLFAQKKSALQYKELRVRYVKGALGPHLAGNFACLPLPREVDVEDFSPYLCQKAAQENETFQAMNAAESQQVTTLLDAMINNFTAASWVFWNWDRNGQRLIFRPTCVRMENAAFDTPADVGILDYWKNINLDANFRLKDLNLTPANKTFSKLKIHRGPEDQFEVTVGRSKLNLKACPTRP